MNVLIINGSPKKAGLTSQMLEIMREEIMNGGATVDVIRANDLTAKPCLGCMACRKSGKCILPEDDSVRLLEKLKAADAVIIGAPCYWGKIPGQLKLLFDRMVYGMMRDTERFPEPLMLGKKCILVSTCTTPWPFNILFKQSRGAINALREICRYSGFKIVATVERGGTQKHPKLSEQDYKRCVKAARKLKD